MYEPFELLAQIDRHPIALVGGLAIAMMFQTIWLVNAIRVSRRDNAYSIPIACTYIWFAHDIGFVVRLAHWKSVYHHWFMDLFWLGMLSAALLEIVFFVQIVRYGRGEVAPNVPRRRFVVLLAAGALGTILVWEYLRSITGDPLYMASSAMTLAAYGLLGPALYLRRGGARGQSPVMWLSFTAMTATWWLTTYLWFPTVFRSPQYLGIGAFAFISGAGMSAIVLRERRSDRQGTVPPMSGAAETCSTGSPCVNPRPEPRSVA